MDKCIDVHFERPTSNGFDCLAKIQNNIGLFSSVISFKRKNYGNKLPAKSKIRKQAKENGIILSVRKKQGG